MRRAAFLLAALAASATLAAQKSPPAAAQDDGERWVQTTLRKMTIEEKVGQMLVPAFQSSYLSTDSKGFDEIICPMIFD